MKKKVMESVNSHWERNGQTFQLAETIMSLNLWPGLVVTVGTVPFHYHAGTCKLNRFLFIFENSIENDHHFT
jgi:hypothetical protein